MTHPSRGPRDHLCSGRYCITCFERAQVGRQLSELRRSGASGTHGDRRTKRQRDRSAQKRRAIADARR